MAYNPYYDARIVYDQKTQWSYATTDARRKIHSDAAEQARKRLRANGYKDIADQIGADSDLVATRDVVEKLRVDSGLKYDKVPEVPEKFLKPTTSTSTATTTTTTTPTTTTSTTTGAASNPTTTTPTTTSNPTSNTKDVVKMASKYNPYSDIQKVYNAKVAWNNATTDEERKRQSDIATAARNTLSAYGYSDVAEQISASGADATAVRKILEAYAPKTAQVETNNLKSNEVNRENAGLFDKYNQTYEDLTTTNPFETDTAKAILAKYDLSGLQSRNNAVASGGASNGGNIDSYAAANALRQQASLVNQGQMAVLDAHQQKIDNVRGLLSDMGVNIDRVFNQDETSKNNNVARLSEQANVTGYTPSEWVIANDDVYNTYLNADGSFKKEMEDVDIQALINSAKASGDTETAKKLAVVRGRKMLGNYAEFGQYANQGDISYMKPQITEARRESEQNDATVRETLKSESADTRYGIDAEKQIAAAKNQNAIDQIKAQTEGEKEVLRLTKELSETGGVTQLSEDGSNIFKQVSKNINADIVKNYATKYSLPADYEIIQWNGGTDYRLNLPDGHVASWWKTQIIRPILESSMSEEDKGAVIANLFGKDAVDFAEEVYTEMKEYGLTN